MLVGSGSEVPSSLTTFQNEHAKMKVVSGLPGFLNTTWGWLGVSNAGDHLPFTEIVVSSKDTTPKILMG